MRVKKIIRKLVLTLLAGACALSAGFSSFAQEAYRGVDTALKVYDYAELLTEEEEASLKEACLSLIEENGYDVFLLTIDDNNVSGASADRTLTFIEDFGDYNGFGLGDDKDYVAFIIDMDERSYNIDVVGEHCLRIFTTEIQEDIKDYEYDYMAGGDYYGAMQYFLQRVEECGSREVSGFVGSDEDWQKEQRRGKAANVMFALLKALGIAAGAGLVIVLVKSGQSKTIHKAVDAYPYLDQSSFRITKSQENFIRQYTTTRTISSSSGGSGSSSRSSGHTSTHRSSSGRSHGGGSSRKF